jgi:hypothetical protein
VQQGLRVGRPNDAIYPLNLPHSGDRFLNDPKVYIVGLKA